MTWRLAFNAAGVAALLGLIWFAWKRPGHGAMVMAFGLIMFGLIMVNTMRAVRKVSFEEDAENPSGDDATHD